MKRHSQRLVYIGTLALMVMYASAVALLLLSCSGCAVATRFNGGEDHQFHLYEPFDKAQFSVVFRLAGPRIHQ
jgi:hypothetical protein